MKKRIGLFLCLVLIITLTGCGSDGSSDKTGNQSAGVNDVLEAEMAEEDSKDINGDQNGIREDATEPETIEQTDVDGGKEEGVDIDLTVLSSTVVYSEVYNMVSTPENYIGKTVKMDGKFALYHDEAADKYYFACIIADATACCSQGIELVLTDDYTYPDDYPAEGGDICVVGVFDTYQEGEYTYCTLKDARIV